MPEAEKRALGDRLRALRDHLGLTQQEVADAGDFPREYMSKFEAGSNLSSSTQTMKLARAFGVGVEAFADYMLGEIDIVDIVTVRAQGSYARASSVAPLRSVEPAERYVAMPAVRLMAKTDGMPPDFIASFEAQLDLDTQPSADDLWTICKGEWARWRGKRVPAGGDALAGIDQPRVRPAPKKR